MGFFSEVHMLTQSGMHYEDALKAAERERFPHWREGAARAPGRQATRADPSLEALASALGGSSRNGYWMACCPAHDDRNPSLLIAEDEDHDRLRFHCFGGCDRAAIRAALKADGTWAAALADDANGASHHIPRAVPHTDAERTAFALERWHRCEHQPTDPAVSYAAQRRRTLAAELLGSVVRVAASWRFRVDATTVVTPATVNVINAAITTSAMLTLFRSVTTAEPVGIQATALLGDGTPVKENGRTLRRSHGPIGRGRAAIQLRRAAGDTLAVAEGFETALAIAEKWPGSVWALGSADALAQLPVLDWVRRLIAFADHDKPGLKAAQSAAQRYATAGPHVKILTPKKKGADWADAS